MRLIETGPDTDNDGLPDDWELRYFSDLNIANPKSDFDNDTFADAAEYSAGTDPLDGRSFLRFETPIELGNKTVVLRWPSVPGRRYLVERSNGDPSKWETVNKGATARLESMEHIDIRIDNGKPVFYRLVVEPE